MKLKGKKKGRGEGGIKGTTARAKTLMALESFIFFSLKHFLGLFVDLLNFQDPPYGLFQSPPLPWSHGVGFSQHPGEGTTSYLLLVSDSRISVIQLKPGIQVA